MTQGPLQANIAVSGGTSVPIAASSGAGGQALAVAINGGSAVPLSATLAITSETVVKAGSGRLFQLTISAPASGSTAGAVYDAATTGTVSASDLIAEISVVNGGSVITFPGGWPVANGIVVSPGTSQSVGASWT